MALNSLKDLLSDNKALSVLRLDGVEFKDLRFPNNESYRGGWRDARVGAAAPAARQFAHKLQRVLRCIAARVQFCLSDSQVLEHAPGSAVGVRPPCSLAPILPTTLALTAARGRGLLHLGGRQHVRGRVACGPQARLGHVPLAQRCLVLRRVARRLHAGAHACVLPLRLVGAGCGAVPAHRLVLR